MHGVENVPKDKPLLFLANHQNALLDALLIAVKCGRFSYFLTRAAVFKKSFVSKILNSLQMLPVYRVRDGWSTISKNNAIFESCTHLLNNNEAVVIFPEGSHNLVRRVRPLSKGFTRVVFDTLEKYPDLDIQIVPIGLNFTKAISCPDSTAIFFGAPFSAKDYVSDHRNEGVIRLKGKVHSDISQLTTHILEQDYLPTLNKLEEMQVDFLNPSEVNQCIKTNFKDCTSKQYNGLNWLRSVLKMLLIVNLIVPYLVWKFIVKPKVKEPEFISTFRFAIVLTLVPFYILLITVMLGSMFTLNVGIVYLAASLILALATVKT